MNVHHQTPSSSLYDAISKIIQPCLSLLRNFSFGYPVHPLDPVAPEYSEYLLLSTQKHLRIIHVKPYSINKINNNNRSNKERDQILMEEYWFTRWNKPLRSFNYNCSLGKSRQLYSLPKYRTNWTDLKEFRIKNIEEFVENFVQETLREAFQESYRKVTAKAGRKRKINSGSINIAFTGDSNNEGEIHPDWLYNGSKLCNHFNNIKFKKKPVMLLLHGIGDSADIWWNVINTFVDNGYEVLAPDMIGHGFSSVPSTASDYKFQNILQYTVEVFDHYIGCDETRTCIIVAHSYGCSLATALCQHRSQQIIQLILISGGGPTPLAPPAKENEISNIYCLRTLIKPLLFCGVQRTILYPLRGKHFEACNTNNGVPNYILQYIENGQNWPEGDASFHRRILIPTLLVHGLQDNKVTLVQQCEMERTIPRAFLELIPNAGHMCMLEAPECLSHMVLCFIEWWSKDNFGTYQNKLI